MRISEKFTIDDIHKIRYYNYEMTKNLSKKELIEKTKSDMIFILLYPSIISITELI